VISVVSTSAEMTEFMPRDEGPKRGIYTRLGLGLSGPTFAGIYVDGSPGELPGWRSAFEANVREYAPDWEHVLVVDMGRSGREWSDGFADRVDSLYDCRSHVYYFDPAQPRPTCALMNLSLSLALSRHDDGGEPEVFVYCPEALDSGENLETKAGAKHYTRERAWREYVVDLCAEFEATLVKTPAELALRSLSYALAAAKGETLWRG
jgi:hypothetical protein